MSDPFLWVKWIHVLSSTILFGFGLGTAVHLWLAFRCGNIDALASVLRNVVFIDWVFTGSSGIVQAVSGMALVLLKGYPAGESWLVTAYVLFGVAALCWFVVVVLQIRLRDMVCGAVAAGASLPPDCARLMRYWVALGWPAFLALVTIFWLMVSKPDLW